MGVSLTLTVNGRAVTAEVDPRTLLVQFIRDGARGKKATHLAMIFDKSEDSFRKALYPAYKANRDHELVKARLQDVADAARGTQNLLYPMKEALRADATLGEVSDALREVFGVYQPGR